MHRRPRSSWFSNAAPPSGLDRTEKNLGLTLAHLVFLEKPLRQVFDVLFAHRNPDTGHDRQRKF